MQPALGLQPPVAGLGHPPTCDFCSIRCRPARSRAAPRRTTPRCAAQRPLAAAGCSPACCPGSAHSACRVPPRCPCASPPPSQPSSHPKNARRRRHRSGVVLAADIDVDAWDSSDFGGGSSGAAGFGAAADTASVSDGEAADPIDVDATEVDPLDTEYDEYDGGDDDDDDDAGGMDEDDLARPHDQWQMGLDEAGGLPELGGFAGWRDGIATDGSTWTPEMDVSEEEWETIKEGDRLRMQELMGGHPISQGGPGDQEEFDPSTVDVSEGGYTPWPFVEVSDEKINHEITVEVRAPLESCFAIWADRLNYMQWFTMIKEMAVLPEEDEEEESERFAGLFLRYQWGLTPELELYTVLEKTLQMIQGDSAAVMEQSVDGFPLIGSAELQRMPDGEDGRPCTAVTLQLSYYLPDNLLEFVGALGVYGDVNDLLADSMLLYAQFCEQQDLEEVGEVRRRGRAEAVQAMKQVSDNYHANVKEVEDLIAELEADPDYAAQAAQAAELGVNLDDPDDEDLDILDRANGDRANGASASEGEYQDESGEFDDQHGDFDDQHGDFDDQAGEFDGQAGESDGEPDDEVDQHSELLRDLPRDSPRVLDGLSTAEEAAAAMAAGGGDVDGEEADDALTHKQRLAREFAEQVAGELVVEEHEAEEAAAAAARAAEKAGPQDDESVWRRQVSNLVPKAPPPPPKGPERRGRPKGGGGAAAAAVTAGTTLTDGAVPKKRGRKPRKSEPLGGEEN